MKPVIFLDIDGVLNTRRYMKFLHETGRPKSDMFGYVFDPVCVDALRQLVIDMKANVEIVISSTWRYKGLHALQEMWEGRSLPGKVVDTTATRSCAIFQYKSDGSRDLSIPPPRGLEIEAWLRGSRSRNFNEYCIIDDDHDMLLMQAGKFVPTNNQEGLTLQHVPNARRALMGENIIHNFEDIAIPWQEKFGNDL